MPELGMLIIYSFVTMLICFEVSFQSFSISNHQIFQTVFFFSDFEHFNGLHALQEIKIFVDHFGNKILFIYLNLRQIKISWQTERTLQHIEPSIMPSDTTKEHSFTQPPRNRVYRRQLAKSKSSKSETNEYKWILSDCVSANVDTQLTASMATDVPQQTPHCLIH